MGWSIDTKQHEIERIFRRKKRKCKITHPESTTPQVIIRYEGDPIDLNILESIIELFPDFVYVHFVPNTLFPEDKSVGLGETVEPTGSNPTATV